MKEIDFHTHTIVDYMIETDEQLDRMEEIFETGRYEIPEGLQLAFANALASSLLASGICLSFQPPNEDPIGFIHQQNYDIKFYNHRDTAQHVHEMFKCYGFALFSHKCDTCNEPHPCLIFDPTQNEDLLAVAMGVQKTLYAVPFDLPEEVRFELHEMIITMVMSAFAGDLFTPENITRIFADLDLSKGSAVNAHPINPN